MVLFGFSSSSNQFWLVPHDSIPPLSQSLRAIKGFQMKAIQEKVHKALELSRFLVRNIQQKVQKLSWTYLPSVTI